MLNIMLGNKLIKGVISKFISRSIRKSTGYETKVTLNDLDIREEFNDYIKIKLDAELVLAKDDLEKLLNSLNKDWDFGLFLLFIFA